MKRIEILFGILRVPLDVLAAGAASLVGYLLRSRSIDLIPGVQILDPPTALPPWYAYVTEFVVPAAILFVAVAALLKLYALQVTRSAWREMGLVLEAAALWIVLVMGWYFFVRKELFFSRAILLHATVFLALFSIGLRALLLLLQRALLRVGIGARAVLSFGGREPPCAVRDVLAHDPRYRLLGHARALSDLERCARGHTIDLVLHTDPSPHSGETMAVIEYCRNAHIGYGCLPPVFADAPHKLRIENLGFLPMLRFQATPLEGWGRVLKRLFDLLLSAVFLVVLSPLLLGIALGILFCDGWPVSYVSWRVGEGGRVRIPVLKFRTMVKDADRRKEEVAHLSHRRDGPLFKIRDDPRVTRFGRVLRRFSLDELPQLWNVLRGQLSLVGPRPHLLEEVSRYAPAQCRVFAVRPGMTGLAQIAGRSDLPFEEEVRWDLQYIEEWSILLDLWILWRTLFVIFRRKGAD